MANSYTTVPAIIPGNLTVQGNLTVAGSQFMLGALQRKYRIQERGNGGFVETVNVDRNVPAQDDPTSLSQVRQIWPTTTPFSILTQAAGTPGTDTPLLYYFGTEFQVFTNSLRLGAAVPYTRLLSVPANSGSVTQNLGQDGVTRDDPAKFGMQLFMQDVDALVGASGLNPAGAAIAGDLRRVFWLNHVQQTFTGTTGQQTIFTKPILAKQLGANGGIYLLILGAATVVSGGQVILGVNWGGIQVNAITFPASTNQSFIAQIYIQSLNLPNSQFITTWAMGQTTPANIQVAYSAADTTVNQNLLLTSNATLAADQFVTRVIEGTFITRTAGI